MIQSKLFTVENVVKFSLLIIVMYSSIQVLSAKLDSLETRITRIENIMDYIVKEGLK